MNYLEKINPNYLDILNQLFEWKILSIEDLKRISDFPNGLASFYKAIRKLESENLVKGFYDSFTNQKFIYLLADGFKAIGADKSIPIHDENRFHDAHLVRLLLQFKMLVSVKEVLLDHQIKRVFPLTEHLPDAIITGRKTNEFHLAIELELTQKSKERIKETYQFYDSAPFFNNVIFIFNRGTPYQTYQEVLLETERIKNKNRFMFIYEPQLTRRNYDLSKSELRHQGKTTTIKEILV